MISPGAAMRKSPDSIKLARILCLSLLPCPVIWIGMHIIKNAVLTIGAYHAICLLPAIIWGRSLWRGDLSRPTIKQSLVLIFAAVLFCLSTLFLYRHLGDFLLDSDNAMAVLKEHGYRKEIFLALSIYFVSINPLLEELFWRGVVLNELERLQTPFKNFPLLWSSFSSAVFHYPILRLILRPPGAEIGVLGLTVYGALLAFVYRRTGSIVVAALAHACLTDLAAIVLIAALFDRYSMSPF
jgi:membrane protease YdiL (CAAX protease family)